MLDDITAIHRQISCVLDVLKTQKTNIKTLQAEVNRLNDKLNGVTLINQALVAATSANAQTEAALTETLENLISSGRELPGESGVFAKQILQSFQPQSEQLSPTSIFQVLQGGLSNRTE